MPYGSRRLLLILLLMELFWAGAQQESQVPAGQECTGPVVTVQNGDICGLSVSRDDVRVDAWLGIPYAEAPVAELRWADPVRRAPWPDIMYATRVGNICPQTPNPLRIEDAPEPAAQDEDCLNLNIWAPAERTGELLPVLVFIHGGAFTHGSGMESPIAGSDWHLQDGSFLAASGQLLVVSFNYRLGALGFLADAGATDLQGNFGFQDQILALQWLQANLAAFGGDPQRVTLAGESAGAMSVGLHLLASPASTPLFQAAIMQSNPLGITFRTKDAVRQSADAFLLSTGCLISLDQLACLRDLPVDEILDAQESWVQALNILDDGLQGILPWAPVVDSELITQQPLHAAAAAGSSKPLLIGYTADEGLLFIAFAFPEPVGNLVHSAVTDILFGVAQAGNIRGQYPHDADTDLRETLSEIVDDSLFICPALALAEATAPSPAYVYRFSHAPGFDLDLDVAQCSGRSCHATELSFVFGTAGVAGGFSTEEAVLSEQMRAYWTAFVTGSGQPGSMDPWPAWTAEAREQLDFAVPNRIVQAAGHNCDLWKEWAESL